MICMIIRTSSVHQKGRLTQGSLTDLTLPRMLDSMAGTTAEDNSPPWAQAVQPIHQEKCDLKIVMYYYYFYFIVKMIFFYLWLTSNSQSERLPILLGTASIQKIIYSVESRDECLPQYNCVITATNEREVIDISPYFPLVREKYFIVPELLIPRFV